jgi:DNA primase
MGITVTGDRLDWDDIKDRVDVAAIATALFGPAPSRSGRRLLWRCPFHRPDDDPSFQVDPAERRWKCWPCNLGGDAPALVMKLQGVGFREAVRIVAELAGIIAPSSRPARPRPPARAGPARPSMPTAAGPPGKAAAGPPDRPAGLDRREAERLIAEASERLWTPAGSDARRYLEGRGLTEATIRRHRLGWADKIRMPKRDGGRWPLSGITIPWFDSGRLTRVKVRRFGLVRGSRYIEAFASGWRVYPGPEAVRPGMSLIIVEGEFDCMLMQQEVEDLASVVTFGSSSARPDPSMWLALARCSQLFAALDGDPAGDDAAAEWGGRAIRVRPPCKDWTELRVIACNSVRYIWGGILRRPGTPWDELMKQRWGPGLIDPAPGIDSHGPARGGEA